VGVDVDRKVGILLADGANKKSSSLRLEDTSHILDTQDMSSQRHDLVDQAKVVLKVVFLVGVEHISRVTDSSLNDTTSSLDGLDTNLELVNVIQSVKDTENVDTVLLGLFAEVVNGIVGETIKC
jgi:hypothetical protein